MAIVRMPDGRLAHFVDGVSPEELRRYIVPDVPDAVADPGPSPSAEQLPLDLVVPNLPTARRLPGEIDLMGAEQVPFDLVVPNLPSSRRLPGEINHSVPGMPMQRPGEPEWDFYPFPDGDDGGAFRNRIMTELAEREVDRAQPPERYPAESGTAPAGADESGGGFIENGLAAVFGRSVGDEYQMPNLYALPVFGGILGPMGYDGRINSNPSFLPLLDPISVVANEAVGNVPVFGPDLRNWSEEIDARLASWIEGKPVTAEEREAINAAAAANFPLAARLGAIAGEYGTDYLLGRYVPKLFK